VLGLTVYEKLFDDPSIPSDAKERARDILNGCKGSSMGSYSDSAGKLKSISIKKNISL
jgi:alanine transaminase